ncbi:hypothetical protein M426DRAFT_179795 [Hypoxylon sp. CI-4A]|nr:hypothetical protein M426DRAFT_179795 [Hypoxylon sp. CI-4A]
MTCSLLLCFIESIIILMDPAPLGWLNITGNMLISCPQQNLQFLSNWTKHYVYRTGNSWIRWRNAPFPLPTYRPIRMAVYLSNDEFYDVNAETTHALYLYLCILIYI